MTSSLRTRIAGLDLQAKITLSLVIGSLAISSLIAIVSFGYFRHQLLEQASATLEATARLEQREMELAIGGVLAQVESLAANTVTANALADSAGRETYLVPLFANLKFPLPGTSVVLTDYRGKALVQKGASAVGGLDPETLARQLQERPDPRAFVSRSPQGQLVLTTTMPVIYRLSGNVEGMVAVGIPLDSLASPRPAAPKTPGEPDTLRRIEAGPGLAIGPVPDASMLSLRVPVRLQVGPQHPLFLSVMQDRDEVLHSLNLVVGIYLAGGLAIIAAIVMLSRRAARALSAPMRNLSEAALEIATTGRPSATPLPAGPDEFGRLAAAFNRMVERLADSYAALESRVEERTAALQRSEARLRYVMDATGEGIWDWNIATGRVTHNPTWCELLGLDMSYLDHPMSAFVAVLHPDDRDEAMAQVARCLETGAPYRHEHRMLRADGTEIWILDRGAVVERDPAGKPTRMVGSISDINARRIADQRLKERELYLRATLDNLPFLFWLKDAAGRFLAVNKVFAETCGRGNPEDVVGLTDFDVWPAKLAEAYRADDVEVMTARQDRSVEEPVESPSGRRWIETYKKPVVSEDGRALGTVGFARDVTLRKEMEQQLAASEQRWELAVSGANDGIWDWIPNTGEMYVSERWKTMLGYAGDEIAPRIGEWMDRVHPDDVDRVLQLRAAHLARETAFFQVEHRVRCRDGGYKWILSRGRALFDAAGIAIRMSGSNTDITESRAAQARLQDRTEQLNAIFALSPDGFISFDKNRQVKYVSPAIQRMLGLGESDLVGLPEAELLKTIDGLCVGGGIGDLENLARGREMPHSEGRVLIELERPGKRVLEVGLRRSLAETVSQILYFRDVTHETEVDRMKSEFLSTAAHELRTPMASVYGFSELLLNQEFDEDTRREILTTIFRQSDLMASIINELLDLARIEARRGKDFVIERIDVAPFVQGVASGYKPPAGRNPPAIALPADPVVVRGDRKKLQQAMTNVLSNAYKYSPDGGGVELEVIAPQPGSAEIGLRIIDHGIGMTPGQCDRVGERFFRADTSGKIPGTGLGMAIVKEIVALHRGRLDIRSTPGQGTQVTLWIPAN